MSTDWTAIGLRIVRSRVVYSSRFALCREPAGQAFRERGGKRSALQRRHVRSFPRRPTVDRDADRNHDLGPVWRQDGVNVVVRPVNRERWISFRCYRANWRIVDARFAVMFATLNRPFP